LGKCTFHLFFHFDLLLLILDHEANSNCDKQNRVKINQLCCLFWLANLLAVFSEYGMKASWSPWTWKCLSHLLLSFFLLSLVLLFRDWPFSHYNVDDKDDEPIGFWCLFCLHSMNEIIYSHLLPSHTYIHTHTHTHTHTHVHTYMIMMMRYTHTLTYYQQKHTKLRYNFL